jgi:glycosyltransferase involved in cell wall biosynthesis
MLREIKVIEDSLPTISCVMIVKNEEKNLKQYLSQYKDAFDELIVVDTGSTDNTIELAESLGAKVFHYKWNDDFSAARNCGIKEATKDYIIWLDADDSITVQNVTTLKVHLMQNPNTAVFLRLLDLRGNTSHESIQLRVFPNHKGIHFNGRVHEQITNSINTKEVPYSSCNIPVAHYGYSDDNQLREKLNRNMQILTSELLENPDDLFLNQEVARTACMMGSMGLAIKCIDKALKIAEAMDIESVDYKLNLYLIKLNTLISLPSDKEVLDFINIMLDKFPDHPLISLTAGEVFFKYNKFEEAYNSLIKLKSGKLPLSTYSIDSKVALLKVRDCLAVSSLYVGDFDTAELMFRETLRTNDFTIRRTELKRPE